MKLIATPTSPYARKIRIALAEKQLPFEFVVESPWEANSTVPESNPLGKVPVLVDDAGEIWFDSPVMLERLETLGVEPRLIPADPFTAVRARQIEALADGIMDATVAIVLEGKRPETNRSTDMVGRQLQKIERGLNRLDQLAAGDGFIGGGSSLSVADIATVSATGFIELRLPQLDWRADRPALATLVDRLLQRDSFSSTIPPKG